MKFLCSVLVKWKKEVKIKSPYVPYDCAHREKIEDVLLWVSACQLGLEAFMILM